MMAHQLLEDSVPQGTYEGDEQSDGGAQRAQHAFLEETRLLWGLDLREHAHKRPHEGEEAKDLGHHFTVVER